MATQHPPSTKLRRLRSLFFQIGLIVGLGSVWLAFQYQKQTYGSSGIIEMESDENWKALDQMPPINVEYEKPTSKDNHTKPAQVAVQTQRFRISEVEQTAVQAIKPAVDLDSLLDALKEVKIREDLNEDITIHDYVSEMPSFPGGDRAMMEFISKNVVYPEIALRNGISGRVVVSFIIEKDGRISGIEIIESAGWGLDEAAARVIGVMPLWNPGVNNYRPVRVRVKMPIKFQAR